MPNVIGLELQAALASMVTAGARVVPLGYFQADPVTVTWKKAAGAPFIVLAQSPSSGNTIAANGAATLTVSSPPVAVSNFGGVGS